MKRKVLFIALLAIILTACKKFVEVPTPPDIVVSGQVFTDDKKAASVVTSIYGSMINGSVGFSNCLVTLYAGMASEELSRFNPSLTHQEFLTNELSPSNAMVGNIWTTAYKHIYYANAAMEGLEASQSVSEPVKQQLLAECKFIRAYCYFYLVNLWGDVPLVLNTDYRVNQTLPRTPVSEVYETIKKDLEEAKAALPPSIADRTRPAKWAAAALLARVHLYNGEWAKAEEEAGSIIQSGHYTPLGSLQDVFKANSREAIFQLAPTAGYLKETQEMRPLGSLIQTILTTGLVSSFAPGDLRRGRWVDSVTNSGNKYYYAAKYRNTASTPSEYYTLLRVSEQYLIRAEARAQLNDLEGAIEDLNVIRARAGLTGLSFSLSRTEVLEAVEQEKRWEFFAEWGHRWFDLKRWGRAETIIGAIKSTWQTSDEFFPIPQEDMAANPFLVQNPGY